jgi:hypothetical protein
MSQKDYVIGEGVDYVDYRGVLLLAMERAWRGNSNDDPPSGGGTGVDGGSSDWCRRRAADRSPNIAAAAVRRSAEAAHAAPTRVRATGRRQRQDIQHSVDHGTPARTIAGPRCGMPAPSDCRPRPAQSARCLRAQLYK